MKITGFNTNIQKISRTVAAIAKQKKEARECQVAVTFWNRSENKEALVKLTMYLHYFLVVELGTFGLFLHRNISNTD